MFPLLLCFQAFTLVYDRAEMSSSVISIKTAFKRLKRHSDNPKEISKGTVEITAQGQLGIIGRVVVPYSQDERVLNDSAAVLVEGMEEDTIRKVAAVRAWKQLKRSDRPDYSGFAVLPEQDESEEDRSFSYDQTELDVTEFLKEKVSLCSAYTTGQNTFRAICDAIVNESIQSARGTDEKTHLERMEKELSALYK
jgi:hypothetical protein